MLCEGLYEVAGGLGLLEVGHVAAGGEGEDFGVFGEGGLVEECVKWGAGVLFSDDKEDGQVCVGEYMGAVGAEAHAVLGGDEAGGGEGCCFLL